MSAIPSASADRDPPFRLILHAQRSARALPHGDIDGPSADTAADEEVVATSREALQRDPSEADYYFMLGEALLRLGRAREAQPELEEAVRRHPHDATYHDVLACALWQQGAFEAAASEFQEAVRLNPQHAAALNGSAAALVELGRSKEAVAVLERALHVDGHDGRLHTNLGVALWSLDRTKDALRAFRRAAQLRADSAAVQRNLGLALLASGAMEPALVALRQAAKLRPGDAHARADLADALYAAGRRAEAAGTYDEATRLEPGCLSSRSASRQAREAIAADGLRQELQAERVATGPLHAGWRLLFGLGPAMQGASRVTRLVPAALAAVLTLAVLRAAWVLLPPYVEHYLFADKVVEIARAPVQDDADVFERLAHEIEERGLAGRVGASDCQVATRKKWRRITCAYSVPVRVLPGWPSTLHFTIRAEEPYLALQAHEIVPEAR
jgi:Flp pilus assembly protein TadD